MRRARYEKPCDYRLFVWIDSIRRASFDQVFQFGSAGDQEQDRAQGVEAGQEQKSHVVVAQFVPHEASEWGGDEQQKIHRHC